MPLLNISASYGDARLFHMGAVLPWAKGFLIYKESPTAIAEVCFYESLFIWKCMQHIILCFGTVVCTVSYWSDWLSSVFVLSYTSKILKTIFPCIPHRVTIWVCFVKVALCQSVIALVGIHTYYSDFLEVYRKILRIFFPISLKMLFAFSVCSFCTKISCYTRSY